MAEYIEKENAKLLVFEYGIKHRDNSSISSACENLKRQINHIPATDVRPVVKARWEENKRGNYCFVCSNCGFGFPTGFVWYDCNRESDELEFSVVAEDADLDYCPNCGARMEGEDNV